MGGPPTYQRYNAKARGSVAGGSHKKRKRPKVHRGEAEGGGQDGDEGGHGIGEVTEGSGRGKMSAKKRKRLESYVTKKLKNEEKAETLKLLASLTPSTSTLSALASSSTLGQRPMAPVSAQERQDTREDLIVRRGIDRLARAGRGRKDSDEDSDGSEKSVKAASTAKAKMSMRSAEKPPNVAKAKKENSWTPTLLRTQPQSDSSDFDSSESENDGLAVEDGARNVSDNSGQMGQEPTAVTEVAPEPTKRAAPKSEESFGGALKRGADGKTVTPKILPRRQKMPLGRNRKRIEPVKYTGAGDSSSSSESESSDSGSMSSESASDEDDSEEDSDGSGADSGSATSDGDVQASDAVGSVKKRAAGFKAWALKQMGQPSPAGSAKPSPPPFAQSPAPPSSASIGGSHLEQVKRPMIGPLGAALNIPSSSLLDEDGSGPSARPLINRPDSVAASRLNLPILAEEQGIVEAIRMNSVVIIAGETGSGKTTQVPQMLYEAGFGYKDSNNPGMIAITQPRRVAAVSLSARVREELGLPSSSALVAHQIRYSSTTSPETSIKFMTDGVLLREMAGDFLLSRYSVVIVDEAHERGVNTDVLIGLLSRVAKLREKKWRESREKATKDSIIRPLRIVIMSATLRISDFASNTTLFASPPPVVHIPARQHPVTTHFSRKTVGDYVGEAYKKVCKIHARLPPGGILVFLTGQGEIQGFCRKLEAKYGSGRKAKDLTAPRSIQEAEDLPRDAPLEAEDIELGQDNDLAADVDDGAAVSDPEALDSDDEIPDVVIQEETEAPMHVLPLYSLLPNDQQMRVFQPPPESHRLVIVATNVAETSVTIPGIRYVVDSGRSKERHFDPISGVQTFQVSWISKASASQRAGRAGRTGPGHVYRLYSSALFEDHFEAYSKPEILRMPIEGVVLQMKSMNIDAVINFPFPTSPDRSSLAKAEQLLTHLGALEKPTRTKMVAGTEKEGVEGGRITSLGLSMAGYPVSPRFAKMLVIGNQHDCLPYVIAIVACLSVGDPFVHEQSLELGEDGEGASDEDESELRHITKDDIRKREERKRLRSRYFKVQAQFEALGGGKSDLFKMLAAIGAYEYDPNPGFCANHFLRPKAMHEIQQLRRQISRIAKIPMVRLTPPSETQLKVLRQIILASSLDKVAVRLDIAMKQPSTSFASSRNIAYRALGLPPSESAFIHPSSTHFHRPPPDYVVFQDITRGDKKTYMRQLTTVNPQWLSELGKSLCSWSKPDEIKVKGKNQADQVRNGEREVWVVPHFGDLGVDLPPKRMKQRREGTRWVLVE
ncbi:P-loop containing nucleoside triphosphate hydrolase protein [Kockovaella imperatae]|uniref:RNA helicase n=1 Tax=Kockovaella imperatae TaxID=4999 RepID=A0A1Y1UD58_9TREE|nr:P-loop containing nucleoside triphosphate hydrolase protein [Kockovaella imperatae]ORX35970.1 P-loop containing nucleoside triphosphate hydrolase protein [Kockovaella imperatae]